MEIESMFKAMGEPMRCKILMLLSQRKHCTRSLSGILGITESAVSQHLRVLKDAGLISGERYGHHVHYSPVPEALDAMASALMQIKSDAAAAEKIGGTCQCSAADRREGHRSVLCHEGHVGHEGHEYCHGDHGGEPEAQKCRGSRAEMECCVPKRKSSEKKDK